MSSHPTHQHRAHRSIFADDPLMQPLIAEFVGRLAQQVTEIRQAMHGNDSAFLQRACHQLKGSGKSYGFAPISEHAAAANEKLRAGLPLSESLADLHALLGYIEHIEGFRPA